MEASGKTTSTFKIEGMTCSSCVEKLTQRIKTLSDVQWVNVNLSEKKADIIADRVILIGEIRTVIADLPKYKVDFYEDPEKASSLPETKSFYQTYKPLIVLFAYVILFSVAFQVHLGQFSAHFFMNHLMAGFFIGLSFFKFLDLKSFATAFSNYDPIAKKWKFYGGVYPFIELALGFLYIADQYLVLANVLTIVVLGITTIGVYQKIKSKTLIQCACLGSGFNLPLSKVTVLENLTMVTMAVVGLLNK